MGSFRFGFVSLFMRLMAVARYRFIVELTVIFVLVWCGCAVLVYVSEHGVNHKVQTLWDAVYSLLVTMTTSGDSGVTPVTPGGRLVMGIAVILSKLLTALLCALAAAVLIERKVKEEMGLKMHKLDHHIVLIGWNLKGKQIISTLRADAMLANTPILIMADLEHKPVDDPMVLFTRSSYPVRGECIERACLGKADTVVVLANYNEKHHADALTAVNCMLTRQVNPQARIIAELLDPAQRLYLEAAGANEVVGIGEVGGFLLAEATIGNDEARKLLAFVANVSKNLQTSK
ncbi:MAG TPA: ion channel [Aquabacterium sp.]|nr:ion channel [Aquabacterium sp.]